MKWSRILACAAIIAAWGAAHAQTSPAERWEAQLDAFAAQDEVQPPPEHPVVFTGSSSIRLWDVAAAFPAIPALNRGFGGSTIPEATALLDRLVTRYNPGAVVFYSGDNDVAGGATAAQVLADVTAFVDALHAALPDTPVILLAIKPSPSRWKLWPVMDEANTRIAAFANARPAVTFVDVATPMLDAYGRPRHELFLPDQLHLNDAGYTLWTSLLLPILADTADDEGGDALVVLPNRPPVQLLAPAPVEPGRTYAIAWDMNVVGEKRWRFLADFAGVHITFLNAAGRRLSTISRHTHCWETLGWRPAWVIVTAPPNATHVTATMAIEAKEDLPGQFELRNAAVEDVTSPAIPEGQGLLHVVVTGGDGVPTPARIYVRNERGESVTPRYAFTADLGGACFYLQDQDVNAMALTPGTYTVRALKGFEYDPVEVSVEVRAGEIAQADLTLAHVAETDGWVSGDHHVHLFRHGASLFPMINLDDVYTIAKAEGIEYLPFMGADKVAETKLDRREPDFLAMVTEEMTRDLWGHMCPIGVREWPRMLEYGEVWPMNYYWIAAAEKAGGAMAYAHPYGPIIDGLETHYVSDPDLGSHIAREFPIDVASGLHCTLDVLAKEDRGGDFAVKLRDTMRLLSLGFRVGITGSTDFHVDQARQPIGGIRTYAKAGLAWDQIAAAYRDGKTFATNGPLLALTVNGAGIGDTARLAAPGDVACAVRAESPWGVDVVELWYNGVMVAEVDAVEGRVDDVAQVAVDHSGWLLAMAKGAPHPEVMNAPEGKPMVEGQYAITSPVYLAIDGQPAPLDPDHAQYFVAWCDAVGVAVQKEIEAFESAGGRIPQDVRENIVAKLLAARSAFARLGGGGSRADRLRGLEPTQGILGE